MTSTAALHLPPSDVLVCPTCLRDAFVGEARGKFVLVDAESRAAGSFVYLGPGAVVPRFMPAEPWSPAPAMWTPHSARCRTAFPSWHAEAPFWERVRPVSSKGRPS